MSGGEAQAAATDSNRPVEDTHGKTSWEQVAEVATASAQAAKEKVQEETSFKPAQEAQPGFIHLGNEKSPYDTEAPVVGSTPLLSDKQLDTVVQAHRQEVSAQPERTPTAAPAPHPPAEYEVKRTAKETWAELRRRAEELSDQGQARMRELEAKGEQVYDSARDRVKDLSQSAAESASEAARQLTGQAEGSPSDRPPSATKQGQPTEGTSLEQVQHKGKELYRDAKQEAKEGASQVAGKIQGPDSRQNRSQGSDVQGQPLESTSLEQVQHKGKELYHDAKQEAKEGASQVAGKIQGPDSRQKQPEGSDVQPELRGGGPVLQAGQQAYNAARDKAAEVASTATGKGEKQEHASSNGSSQPISQAGQRGAQDAVRGFLAALGAVPPFTWLEAVTRDEPPPPPPEPSVSQKASQQAQHVVDGVKKATHRVEDAVVSSKDAVVSAVKHTSQRLTGSSDEPKQASSSRAHKQSEPEKDELDHAVEKTEGEAKSVLHSIGNVLASPFRRIDEVHHSWQDRLQPKNDAEAKLAAGLIPSNTAAALKEGQE